VIKDLSIMQLTDFYETWLGMKLVEETFGMETWSGIIWQMDLFKNGINYRRTLDRDKTHNRVKVVYTDTSGDQQTIAWSENTNSSGIYGTIEQIYTIGVTGSTAATAFRDNKLTRHAWPLSRQVGSTTVGVPSSKADGLYITCVGYWTTLDWEYYETSTSGDGDSIISTLVGTSEFVTAGRLEDNPGIHDAEIDGTTIGKTTREFIEDIIETGDSSGNVWLGGCYAGQKFHYKAAPTTVDYNLINGRLYDKGGTLVIPETLEAGFYVRDTNAPAGYRPPGTSNVWDDPQVSWVEEVEFEYPNILRLNFPGEPLGVDQIWSKEIIMPEPEQTPSPSYPGPSYPSPSYPSPSYPSPSYPSPSYPTPTPPPPTPMPPPDEREPLPWPPPPPQDWPTPEGRIGLLQKIHESPCPGRRHRRKTGLYLNESLRKRIHQHEKRRLRLEHEMSRQLKHDHEIEMMKAVYLGKLNYEPCKV
jgi:hypothetical protein